jgi:hypothetical protein
MEVRIENRSPRTLPRVGRTPLGQKLRAPRSQPDHTKSATTRDHRGGMASIRSNKEVASDTRIAESIPELKPWRELGWIFKDGEAVVIERQRSDVRIRKVADQW